MHAGAVEGQSAFAAEGVVDGPEEGGARREDRDDQFGQAQREGIEVPGGMAEETMKPRPVSVADIAAGEDDLGDIVSPVQNFLQLPKETGVGHPGDRSREGGGTE